MRTIPPRRAGLAQDVATEVITRFNPAVVVISRLMNRRSWAAELV